MIKPIREEILEWYRYGDRKPEPYVRIILWSPLIEYFGFAYIQGGDARWEGKISFPADRDDEWAYAADRFTEYSIMKIFYEYYEKSGGKPCRDIIFRLLDILGSDNALELFKNITR